MVTFRNGWHPHDYSDPTPDLTGHLLYGYVTAVEPPESVDWYSKVTDWGMLGNDNAGDCTFAGDGHIALQQSTYGGKPVAITTAEAIAAYSAVTGYDPSARDASGQNPTDKGTTIQKALEYFRVTGFAGFKISAYGKVQTSNHTAVKRAIDEFGALSIGMNLPNTALGQFDNGEPFDVVKGSQSDGGHCMAVFGYDAKFVYVVTWGKICRMTWAFWDAFVEEAWAVVTQAWDAISGMPLEAFGEEFAAETGGANPFAPQPRDVTAVDRFFDWLHNLIGASA